ncbi:MAG: YncE family protein [Parvularculaceae bacterium]
MQPRILAASALLALFASSASAATLIVGNKVENTVSFVDLENGVEVARRETGRAPHEIAVSPDGKRAIVVSYRADGYVGETLDVFDVERAEKITTISITGHKAPHGLKWIAGTNRVIATTEGSKEVIIVDLDRGEVVETALTGDDGAHMVALSPDLKRAYAASIGGGYFAAYDLNPLKLNEIIKAGEGTEAITVTPNGKEIWVGNNNSRSVMIFDAKTLKRKADIKTEGVPIRVEISPDGAVAAVSEFDRNRVLIIDAKARAVLHMIDLPEGAIVPVTMLFSPDGAHLFVAATGSKKIVEIETATWSVARAFDVGEGSDGLGFSPLDVAGE